MRLNNKIVCVTRNVTFDKTQYPALINESIDQSTFQFNPFNVAPDLDNDNDILADYFCPFPEQDIPAIDNRPLQEIIGDISSENILSHC